eukprot:755913-Hanusia_phi.AAC.4
MAESFSSLRRGRPVGQRAETGGEAAGAELEPVESLWVMKFVVFEGNVRPVRCLSHLELYRWAALSKALPSGDWFLRDCLCWLLVKRPLVFLVPRVTNLLGSSPHDRRTLPAHFLLLPHQTHRPCAVHQERGSRCRKLEEPGADAGGGGGDADMERER